MLSINRKLSKKNICVVFFTSFGVLIVLKQMHMLSYQNFWSTTDKEFDVVVNQRQVRLGNTSQIDHSNCKIPNIPLKSNILKKLTQRFQHLKLDNCADVPDFTRLEKYILHLTDPSLETHNCCAQKISRPFSLLNDDFRLDQTCRKFEDRKLDVSEMEFIRVICSPSNNSTHTKINFVAKILEESGSIQRKREKWKSRSKKPISIFVLVIDSLSRTNAYRSLPKTMDYLVKDLNFVNFKGHHPVSEPTMYNALALLMGLKGGNFWGKYKFKAVDKWDTAPFIWNIFNQMEFITGYFEDLPFHGTFNYGGQTGFTHQPTDLSFRPLMLAYFQDFPYNGKDVCFGHRSLIKFLLDYHLESMELLKDVPTFLVSWPVWPQHDVPHSIFTQDNNYLEFFQNFSNNRNLLENTFFVVMADHAFLHGKYAKTPYGLTERRTVPLLIRVPNRLQRERPQMIKNLLWNSEIVTSHFDVYRTLLHLANMSDENGIIGDQGFVKYGRSLLEKLNASRTCEDASIYPTMCSCNLPIAKDNQEFISKHSNLQQLLIDRSQFPRVFPPLNIGTHE